MVASKVQPHNDDSATTYEPLLDTESSLMFFVSESRELSLLFLVVLKINLTLIAPHS